MLIMESRENFIGATNLGNSAEPSMLELARTIPKASAGSP